MNIIHFEKVNFRQIYKLSLNLSKQKIQTRRIWRPLNLHLYLKKFQTYNIVNAKRLYHYCLCLPSDDNISNSDVDKISNLIKKFLKNININ